MPNSINNDDPIQIRKELRKEEKILKAKILQSENDLKEKEIELKELREANNPSWVDELSNKELEEFYAPEGDWYYDTWPSKCIWVDDTTERKRIIKKSNLLEDLLTGSLYWKTGIFFVIFMYLPFPLIIAINFPDLYTENLETVSKWISGVSLAALFIIRFVIYPIYSSNLDSKIQNCEEPRLDLDVYCKDHRKRIGQIKRQGLLVDNLNIVNVKSPSQLKRELRNKAQSEFDRDLSEILEIKQIIKDSLRMNKKILKWTQEALFDAESNLKRKKLPESLRIRVYMKSNFKCVLCKADLTLVKPHIDHIKPLARGGDDSFSNLQALCERCNLSKGSREH